MIHAQTTLASSVEGTWDLSASVIAAGHLLRAKDAPRFPWSGGQLTPKYSGRVGTLALHWEGRLRWNEAYSGNRYSTEARDAYRFQLDVREAYVSTALFGWQFTAGVRQMVWGKADMLRVLDQVNPLDLQMFFLPDLNDMRIAVPMVTGSRVIRQWTVELSYIPWFEPMKLAEPGSEFHIPVVDPAMAGQVILLPERRPSGALENGEAGAQISRSFQGVDLELCVFYTRDDRPVYRQQIIYGQGGAPVLGLRPEYHRQLMLGGSLASNIGRGFVLRSELAYTPRTAYTRTDGEHDGLSRNDTWTALLGLDYLHRNWLFSFQASDRVIDGWSRALAVPTRDLITTLSATGSSSSGRLETRIALTGYLLNCDGVLWQFRETWKPDDRWAWSIGGDFFTGNRRGFFGQFRDRDRIWLEAKRSF